MALVNCCIDNLWFPCGHKLGSPLICKLEVTFQSFKEQNLVTMILHFKQQSIGTLFNVYLCWKMERKAMKWHVDELNVYEIGNAKEESSNVLVGMTREQMIKKTKHDNKDDVLGVWCEFISGGRPDFGSIKSTQAKIGVMSTCSKVHGGGNDGGWLKILSTSPVCCRRQSPWKHKYAKYDHSH